jgi:hypothetical protein
MKPTYQIKIWQEDGWWLARVMEASDDADASPLNAMTQARSLARIEPMGRDLIATILDADEDSFDVKFEYQLPGELGELVHQARGARAWLDAAQDLWHERSRVAARALAEAGYSLRETATLLGLSHQRVDQLLASHSDRKHSNILVLCEGPSEAAWLRQVLPVASSDDLSVLFVVMGGSLGPQGSSHDDQADTQLVNRFMTLLREAASRFGENRHATDAEVPARKATLAS